MMNGSTGARDGIQPSAAVMPSSRWPLLVAMLVIALPVNAQRMLTRRYTVTYVTSSVVYLGSGREENVAVGDTVHIERASRPVATAVVSAVSRRSAAALVITQTVPAAVGDDAVITKERPESPAAAEPRDTSRALIEQPPPSVRTSPPPAAVNVISGRAAMQYIGVLADDPALDLAQPAAVLRLTVRDLLDAGLQFSMYGRTQLDLSDRYDRYGETSRWRHRFYDFSLRTEDQSAPFGFSAGRVTSEFVGGLGMFDGGQVHWRSGDFTAGAAFGAKVQDRSIGPDADETKGALFVNGRFGSGMSDQYNVTLAYGRQMVRGGLDREFLYTQHFLSVGPQFSVYGSSELELNDIENGRRRRTLTMSNAYVSVNYYPAEWLSANVGYDGARTVYLFESMRSFSDTLLDRNLMQGYRTGVTVRLPWFVTVSGNASFRTKKGDDRDARTLSGSVRIADVAGSGVGTGLRFSDIRGVYSEGVNVTFDVDRTFFDVLSFAGRYDEYRYRLVTADRNFVTRTVTVTCSYRITRSFYASASADRVFDDTMGMMRMFAEFGYRF